MQSDSKAHTFNLHGVLPRDNGNYLELGRGEFKNDLRQCSAVQYVSLQPYKEKGTTDMNLNELQELVMDMEAWRAAVHGLQRVRHD